MVTSRLDLNRFGSPAADKVPSRDVARVSLRRSYPQLVDRMVRSTPMLLEASRGIEAVTLAPARLRGDSPFRPQPLVPPSILDVPLHNPSRMARVKSLLQYSAVSSHQQDGIGIYLENRPRSGHASAAVEVVRELRERFGVHQQLLLIAEDEKTLNKLRGLLSNDPSVSLCLPSRVKRLRLLIVPAADGAADYDDLHDIFPHQVRIERGILLQPFTWSDDRWTQSTADEGPIELEGDADSLAYQPPRPRYENFGLWVAQQMGWQPRSSLMSQTVNNLNYFHANLQSARIDSTALYGIFDEDSLAPWLDGIQEAQSSGAVKGTVALWFNSTLPPIGEEHQISLSSSTFIQRVDSMANQGRGITVWNVGKLPSVIFQELHALCSLPTVGEGRATSNQGRIRQRPYVSAFDEELAKTTHPEYESTFLLRHNLYDTPHWGPRDSGLALGEMIGRELVSPEPSRKKIAEFIIESQRPRSAVAEGYARAGRQNRLPTSDQLYMALARLADDIYE